MRLISKIKTFIVPIGFKPRRILFGPFKGIRMCLSLEHQSQVLVGLFERETHPFLKQLSKDIATAIDIGAAQGEYTLFFLLRTAAHQVFVFEPDATVIPLLQRNLEMNNVRDDLRLDFFPRRLDRETPLDSLKSIKTPCLIKMDVDGTEVEILEGARTFNLLPGIRWLIETHSKELETACVRMLDGAGFKTAIIPNAWWRVLVPEQRVSEQNRWLAAWND